VENRKLTAWSPWTTRDFARLVPVLGGGVLVCAVAWTAASGQTSLEDQVGWMSLGVMGLAVCFSAQAIWLLRGRRAVHAYVRDVLGCSGSPLAMTDRRSVTQAGAPSGLLVAGEDLRRFHRPECPIASGREWPTGARELHEESGREACGVCRP